MSRGRNNRNCEREESESNKLRRKYDEAKKEIKRLRNIIKRVSPDRLREAFEKDDHEEIPQPAPRREKRQECPKCFSYEVKTIDVNRLDGKFSLTICNQCGHRSTLTRQKQTNTDSIKECNDEDV